MEKKNQNRLLLGGQLGIKGFPKRHEFCTRCAKKWNYDKCISSDF